MSIKELENKIIEMCEEVGVDPNELNYDNIINKFENKRLSDVIKELYKPVILDINSGIELKQIIRESITCNQ